MADVPGKFFRATKVRTGVSPSSPGAIEGEVLPPLNPPGGGLNSVGLTMPSAFNVANSPLTSNGSLDVTGAGTTAQYIRGDGSLADFPESSGGGSSISYYLNGSVNQGTISGIAFKELNKVPILGAGTDFTIAADGYIASFVTDAGDPALLEIPGGNWNFETYFSASSSGGTPTFYVELYKLSGTTLTLIASNSGSPEFIAFGTTLTSYFSTLAVPTTTLALTDRLAIRYYVNHSGRTITLHTENNHLCQIITTFTTGLTALNGLTAQVQTFATGTSGTDFNISSATSIHTFNLPTANATNRGALSSADWSLFTQAYNDKINSAAVTGTTTKTLTLTQQDGGTITASWTDLNTDAVTSVFGRTGAVVAANGDYTTAQVTESGNLYYTDARSRAALSFAAGSGAYNTSTGVITIPTNNNQITNGAGYITSAALSGYLPLTGGTLTGPLNGTSISLSGDITANRYRGVNSLVLNSYTTVNPSSNVYLYSPANDRDAWVYLDSADTSSNWGIYHRQIDSAVSGLPGNSIGFIGGGSSILQAWISLLNGDGYFVGNLSAANLSGTNTGNVTIGTANGLSLSGQILSLGLASGSANGALSSTDWTTFNNKQNALTNPVTGTGTTNYLPKFTGSTTIGDSQIIDDGTTVQIGSIPLGGKLNVTNGNANLNIYFATGGVSAYSSNLYIRGGSSTSTSSLNLGYGGSDNDAYIKRNSDGRLSLGTSQNDKLSIFFGGNVLIQSGGTYTDNGARFQVTGDSTFSGRVGIGTPSPSVNSLLHLVQNTSNLNLYLQNTNGSGKTWALNSDLNGNFNIHDTVANRLTISSTGAATFSSTVTANGITSNEKALARTGDSSWGQFAVANPNDAEVGIVWASGGTGYPGVSSTYTRQWIAGLGPFGTGTDRWSLTNRTLGANTAITVRDNGFVGIGINNPDYRLHLFQSGDNWHYVIDGGTGQLRFGAEAGAGAVIQARTSGGTTRPLYLQRDGGNVLIGTTTDTGADRRLQVAGNLFVDDNITTGNGVQLRNADRPLITRGWDAFTSGNKTGVGRWGVYMESAELFLGSPGTDYSGGLVTIGGWLVNGTRQPNLIVNNQTRNVLIGTTTSTGAKLEVNGDIRTGALGGGYVSGFWKLGRAILGTQPTETYQIIVEINGQLYAIGAANI